MFPGLLIYGANGYTGELVAREAARRGWRPCLAGRSPAVQALAEELGLESRLFALDDPAAVRHGLRDVRAVLHCAGPFQRTARPMVAGCLESGAHYLDIGGEVQVIEELAARAAEARRAGVLLLPAVGFDVVPSDSLAAHLARRLPGAERLTLALQVLGRTSRGTATTIVENLHRGGLVRRSGRLEPERAGARRRRFDFGRGPQAAVGVPWGDLATAYRTTGIGDIEVYMAVPWVMRVGLRLLDPLRPLTAREGVRAYLRRRVQAGPPGPDAAQRARGRSIVFGEVHDGRGGRAAARLYGPEGYAFTVLTALLVVERVLAKPPAPGFTTPAGLLGPDAVLGLAGVTREDL